MKSSSQFNDVTTNLESKINMKSNPKDQVFFAKEIYTTKRDSYDRLIGFLQKYLDKYEKIKDQRSFQNQKIDENIAVNYDAGMDPFSTYCYWGTATSSINEGSEKGLVNSENKYASDQSVVVLVGTAEKWPERFKRPKMRKKNSKAKGDLHKKKHYSIKAAVSNIKNMFNKLH